MKLALLNGTIYIRNTKEEYILIKGLPGAKFDKQKKAWTLPATLEMYERLSRIVKLPESMEHERVQLQRRQQLINTERMKEKPEPLVRYPVKVKLFQHQIRAANMAMYAFGLEE